MEDLKTLLNDDEVFNKVSEKLNGKKVFVGDEANFIPKSRFDEVNSKKNELKNQIDTLNGEIQKLTTDVKNYEQFKTKVEEYQKQDEERKTKSVYDSKKSQLIENLKSKGAKEKYLDLLVSKIDLNKLEINAEGKLINPDYFTTELVKEYSDIFTEVKIQGNQPPANTKVNGAEGVIKNPFSKKYFNRYEQAKLYDEDKTLYEQLKLAAENEK
jgi:outer membrane murein-binding lipoprotein Lpp